MNFDAIVRGPTSGGRLLCITVTALCLTIMYAPVLYLLLASLNPGLQLGLVPPGRYSLTWYFALLENRRLGSALVESALVALTTAAAATPIGLSAALAYRAMTRMRGIFLLVILSAMFVPGTIAGLGLSATLRVVGLTPSWITITIGHLLWPLPFATVVSLIGLSAVKPSTIAAARDLGAGPMRAFVDITLPLMRRNLLSSFLFAFLLSLNEHARAYYLAGRQNTLPLYMFGAMNSGASPTIYAFSSAVFIASVTIVALVFAGVTGRRSEGRDRRRPKQLGPDDLSFGSSSQPHK